MSYCKRLTYQRRLACRCCSAEFPNVNIVECSSDVLGRVSLCEVCHRKYHVKCTHFTSAVRPEDRRCDVCNVHDAIVVCPMCTGRVTPVLLCATCSEAEHSDLHACHLDHLSPVPS